eukprot:8068625-Karenia_brevis.AAC.1
MEMIAYCMKAGIPPEQVHHWLAPQRFSMSTPGTVTPAAADPYLAPPTPTRGSAGAYGPARTR